MTTAKKIPMRMCLACREMKPKREMLRVVKNSAGEVFIDYKGKASGRGAYICDGKSCVAKLCKQRLLNRSFSCDIPPEIYRAIEESYEEKGRD